MLRELAVLSLGCAAIGWNYYVGAKRSHEAHPDDPEFSSARDVRFQWLMFLVPFCAGIVFSVLALIEWFISRL